MGDINLLPEDSRHAPRHHRPVKSRVEYSSGQTQETKSAPVTPPPPAPPALPSPAPHRDTFAEWWKRRRARATAASHVQAPAPQPPRSVDPPRQPAEHHAPKKTADIVQMNLAKPPAHRYTAIPAAVPAPQLIRTMPRPSKPPHARAQQQRLSSGQPRPAADHEAVNLLPDQLITELHPRNRVRDLVVTALSGCVVVLLVYGGMNLYQQKIVGDTKQVEEEIAAVDTTIASYAALQTKAQEVDRRLDGLESVLDGHVLWTPFLSTIEELTLPTVYYTSLSGSAASGSFTVDAVTAAYDQIDPQVRVFRAAPQVRTVTVSSAHEVTVQDTTAASAVAFTMSIEFDPSLFHASPTD